MQVAIIGAGSAGLVCAWELVSHGIEVTVYEQSEKLGEQACSWLAGGMLAPWCEAESAEQKVQDYGKKALSWWKQNISCLNNKGSLVISPLRDRQEISRFARLTENHVWLDQSQINKLEPMLAGRFNMGLWFQHEAHLDPRLVLQELLEKIIKQGGCVAFGTKVCVEDLTEFDYVVDCRGYAARDQLDKLRGVKGEMMILQTNEFSLSRPVRLLHPRHPVYLVPRNNNQFMLGATMLENKHGQGVSALSVLELLNSMYALHPILGEAEIVEMAADIRPAYDDNMPALTRKGKTLFVNGLYRHGFLLSPHMAALVKDTLLNNRFDQVQQCA